MMIEEEMNILLIDDEEDIINFFSFVARSLGYANIDTASTGEEALARVQNKSYDLITLDIQMPGLSGLEVIAILRDVCPHAIIPIISGHIPDHISSEVAGCADALINKPISFDSFSWLLDAADRICKAMHRIRSLGNLSLAVK